MAKGVKSSTMNRKFGDYITSIDAGLRLHVCIKHGTNDTHMVLRVNLFFRSILPTVKVMLSTD